MAANARVRKLQAKKAAAAVPVPFTPEEKLRLSAIEEELLQAGVEVEDRVALRRLALKKLWESDGGG